MTLNKEEDTQINQIENTDEQMPTDVNKILEKLPEKDRSALMEVMCLMEKSSSFYGPIPPPEVFKGY